MSADLPRRGSVSEVVTTWYRDVRIAASLLTRLPVRPRRDDPLRPPAEVMRAYPVVGAGVGLVSGLVFGVSSWSDMPPFAAALLGLAAAVALTAATHEEGLAVAAEELAGGASSEDKPRITREGRIGALGISILILLIGIKASAVASFHSPAAALAALVGAGAVSRAAIPIVLNALLPADETAGPGGGCPAAGDAWAAAALGAFFALFVGIETWLVVLIVCTAAGALLLKLAKSRLAGDSGRAASAVQAVTEAVFLLSAAATEL